MKNVAKLVAYITSAIIILLASCHKENVVMHPEPISTLPPVSQTDSSSWYSWHNYDGSGTGLWAISGFGDIFKNIVSKFDSAFYNDHVKVKLKFADSADWLSIPYVAHDHAGQNSFDVYFSDDNYQVNLGPLGNFLVPRIIILAKPNALIDFLKKVDVKIVPN